MGRLIPAGTGLPDYRYLGIQIEGAEDEYEDELAADAATPIAPVAEEGVGLMASGGSDPTSDPGLDV